MSYINKIREKGFLHFLLKAFLFLIILFLLDISIGSLLKYFYYKQDSGLLFRTNYAIDSTRAEMVIFGSSTANHHYYPNTFEERLHMSLYNAGRDGNSIFYHHSILQGILTRYSPKIAILDFNKEEFKKDQVSYDRISSLLPYYENHPEIRSTILLKSPYEKYKLLSKIYPFNSIIFTIAIGNTDYNTRRKNINDEEGYIPLTRVWNRTIVTDTSNVKYELDDNKINAFESFIRDCVNSHVKLYIVISPRFTKYMSRDSSVIIANKIANEFKIPFYNFSYDPDFLTHPELFADEGHLNDSGAKIYSNKVIDKIIQNKP
ncbi:MAG: hypothetical protein ABIN04_18095 [Ginsengibacter sp.]